MDAVAQAQFVRERMRHRGRRNRLVLALRMQALSERNDPLDAVANKEWSRGDRV